MLETASWLAAHPGSSDLDVGLLFFGREELPITQSALLPLFDRCALTRSIDLAIVMEPTANAIEVGCLGNLNAHGHGPRSRGAHGASVARAQRDPHRDRRARADRRPRCRRDVEIDGLVFREVVSVTSIEGGIAGNVVPDRVEATRELPLRADAHARRRPRRVCASCLVRRDVELTVIGNAPPGPVAVRQPVGRAAPGRGGSRRSGPSRRGPPWRSSRRSGVDAVNFGPGDPQYAHRDDERVAIEALVRSYQVLRGFLAEERAS